MLAALWLVALKKQRLSRRASAEQVVAYYIAYES